LSAPDSKTPLFVDLDGTLIKTDSLLESVLVLVKSNPLYLFVLPLWLLQGRAGFKHEVASRVSLKNLQLPLNEEFSKFLKEQKDKGRQLTLISATNQKAVDEIANRFELFTAAIGSSEDLNLRGNNKLDHIQQLCSGEAFSYAGNSSVDLPIWESAAEVVMVNCTARLQNRIENDAPKLHFDPPNHRAAELWRAMRPHQWLKNGLLFVPLILAHQIQELGLLLQACIGFVSFSLCASSVYLLNDLMDLNADRLHASKKHRPFAAGRLPLGLGVFVHFFLLLLAFLFALFLPPGFFAVLLGYWMLTVLYTFVLKRILLLDLLVLAQLYTIRLVAGAAAVDVAASPWLLAFAMALFFSLAVVKRVTELNNTDQLESESVPGRAYRLQHKRALTVVGMFASLIAVVIIGFYINGEEALRLYSSPMMLWPICILLFLILWRLWGFALGGKLEEDPVLFAANDHPSQLAAALMFLVLYLAI
jgi:4-hydroxybenzoate polyprenyltransferase/phosphoserine phosphatase